MRLGRHEIDLVSLQGQCLVFVEVKTRGASEFCSANNTLRPAQRRRIIAASYLYLREKKLSPDSVRFDLIAIDESKESLKLEHYVDAFGRAGDLR